jgi:hypothetical protein
MSTASRLTLFASLRRDSLLFALVGTLVLLLHSLQPLAAAHLPGAGHMAICTAFNAGGDAGAAGDAVPGGLDDCPVCLIAGACAAAAVHKAAPVILAAVPTPAVLAEQSPAALAGAGPPALPGAPPPAIRAPPFA